MTMFTLLAMLALMVATLRLSESLSDTTESTGSGPDGQALDAMRAEIAAQDEKVKKAA
jgi:hypothetical protein